MNIRVSKHSPAFFSLTQHYYPGFFSLTQHFFLEYAGELRIFVNRRRVRTQIQKQELANQLNTEPTTRSEYNQGLSRPLSPTR